MTPLEILATAIAYIIDADNERPTEERAKILSLFGKHLTLGDMNEVELENLSKKAFSYAANNPLDVFLAEHAGRLTRMQQIAAYINIFETMLVDGQIIEAESQVLAQFETGFQIDRDTVLAVREVIYLKNDTGMFLHPEHPRNSDEGRLRVQYIGAPVETS